MGLKNENHIIICSDSVFIPILPPRLIEVRMIFGVTSKSFSSQSSRPGRLERLR
jgi:hypothetical protein